jgi:hypothetical protein
MAKSNSRTPRFLLTSNRVQKLRRIGALSGFALSALMVIACGGRDSLPASWEDYGTGMTSGGGSAGSDGAAGRGGKTSGGSPGNAGRSGGSGGRGGGGGVTGAAGTVSRGGSSAGTGGGTVEDDLCHANQPVCNGDLATFCDDTGTKYLPGGKDCSLYPGERCRAGSCSCEPALASCNGIEQDGCETDLTKSPDNCGDCGVVCSANHVPTRSCNGTCNGACAPGFADCDGDKQGDGCETAIASDASNCGDCGIACSTNHVSALCSGGQCTGKCEGKFRDCNQDKQGDGCEIDTQSDSNNCGACGNVCKAGTSCNKGKCSKLFTFSGIMMDTPTSTFVGWTECFKSYYGEQVSLSEALESCTGGKLMMACRVAGADVLQLAAYANVEDVLFDTGASDTPHDANGVGWYFSAGRSWGFAPQGDALHRFTCDIVDSHLEPAGVDGERRLCWHTSPGYITAGWRCGLNDTLNGSLELERVLFTAP